MTIEGHEGVLLDVHDVARLLDIHRNTVRRLYTSGGLPHIRVGRSVRFRRQDIDDWVAAQRQAPNSS